MDWEKESRKLRKIEFDYIGKHKLSEYTMNKLNSMFPLPVEWMDKCDHCDNFLRLVMREKYTNYGVNVYGVEDMGKPKWWYNENRKIG